MKSLKSFKKNNKLGILSASLVRYAFLISMSFTLLYPLLYMVTMAFRPMEDLKDPTIVWLNSNWTLENIKTMWEYMDLKNVLINSIFISFGSAALSTAACAVTGYGLARFQFAEKKLWMGVLILTIVVPSSVLTVASYIEMKDFSVFGITNLIELITGSNIEIKLLDTHFVFFLPAMFGAGISSGIFILVFYQFFNGLPKELEDAAYVDGAGPFKTFMKIAVPNMIPATVVVFLLSTVWYWNDRQISSNFTIELKTVSNRLTYVYSDMTKLLGVASGHGAYNEDVVLIQAAMLIAVIPMIILFAVSQKGFMKNVASVGIVG